MAESNYDAIVVGARCAGSPTAMLLARKGYRVLVVDRATFPSDTLSTHLVHPPGVAALQRWGLLDRVVATGCPAIDTYSFDLGPITLTGSLRTAERPVAYGPRRTVLDSLLVGAAAEAGAEVREGFTVTEVVTEDGRVTGICGHGGNGSTVTERARVVIGADGLHSRVARSVRPEQYHDKPRLLCGYYSYWSGLLMHGRFETYLRPQRGIAAWPTNDDLTLVIVGWPFAEFEANKVDIEGNYLATLDMAPASAKRIQDATREERFAGTAVPNYFRQPYGEGGALVGNAGHNKDFITAFGITDAFHDAELCATALDQIFLCERSFDDAMSNYQTTRDQDSLPRYELTTQLATLEPHLRTCSGCRPPPHAAKQLPFVRVNSGVTSPAEFFAPANIQRILATAGGESG